MDLLMPYFIYDKSNPLLFGSGMFLVIFIVFFTIYATIYNKKTLRTIYVLLFSLFFYYKAGGLFVFLLIAVTVANYLLSHLISTAETVFLRKFFLAIAIISNLTILGYFKYTGFFIANINEFAKTEFLAPNIILPIGISFYLFQAISYCTDVYKNEIEAEKSFLNFSFYLCFFPQLVAGPIVRAKEFMPQLQSTPKITNLDLGNGLFLILLGLVKKTVISDFVSLNLVDRIFFSPDLYTPFENLLAVYGYTMQIYCDFSGYSDMAIGLALLLGYKLPINFHTPFKSKNITEFWRRWHISLSSWLRDYLYIPLGGNKNGKIRTYINLFIVMLIGGLWHGASWKFVAWGGLHGIALIIERIICKIFKISRKKEDGKFNIFSPFFIFITFHFVAFSFIFFRAADFQTALNVIRQILRLTFEPDKFLVLVSCHKLVISFMLFGFFIHFIPEKIVEKIRNSFALSPIWVKILILGIVFRISYSVSTSDIQPFIYFQF
jgi:D-alanyl-lipoteichoic acid acyltransferase DltB (MBOAT superfamily)